MKAKLLMFIWGVLISTFSMQAQTVVLSEDFETLPLELNSSGTGSWARSTSLAAGGTYCDTAVVALSGNTYLTTNSFSTTGNYMVKIEFDQICKVEFFDGGFVEYSLDNGTTWTVISSAFYQGSGTMFSNKFSANSYTTWVPAANDSMPLNTWWKHETFDIGTLVGNQPSVMLRFRLSDLNNSGPNMNYGWALDNVLITMALSETTPPSITQLPTIWQDTVHQTGPFQVKAKINDLSGIDTAYIVYNVNGGADNYVGMTVLNVDTFSATIPAQAYNTRIDYFITAVDGSIAANADTTAPLWFYTKKAAPVAIIGAGSSNSAISPTDGNYNYGWTKQIYTANEIGMAGIIDSLSYNVSNAPAAYVMDNQKVFVALIPDSVFSNANMADTSLMKAVYEGSITWDGTGWQGIKLTTPFYYNGVDNLLVYWLNRDGSYTTGYPTFIYTSTSPIYQSVYKNSDTYSVVFPVSTGTLSTSYRPDLKITFVLSTATNDVAISSISEPLTSGVYDVSVPVDVKVKIKNIGSDILTSATINYSVNGVLQTPYNWTGALMEDGMSGDITIGTATFTDPGYNQLVVWTSLPNGMTDEQPLSDTMKATYFACNGPLAGNYTIGASASDFGSFNEALLALINCGISAPVVFNVASGVYNEQLYIPYINGSSSTNTITFRSATGNNADVTLSYTASTTNDNYTIRLDSASNFRFEDLTLISNGASYATALYYNNGSNNNIFDGNHFVGVATTSSTSANLAVIYSPSGTTSIDTMNVFTNNIIENGSYGVYLNGGSATLLEKGLVFSNNQILNPYYRGLYVYYMNAPVIDSNTVISSSTSSTSYYGAYAGYCDNSMQITKNTIINQNSGYGLYMSSNDATSGGPGLVANNMIYVTGTSSSYGIYHSSSSYQNYYYNTVNVASNNSTARGIYVTGTPANNNLVNNIFTYTGPNTSGYAVYISTTAAINVMDYNDLYSTGSNLGYWGAARVNLATWQLASTKDAHSVSVDPMFASATDLHVSSPAIFGKGTPLAEVSTDIDGETRNLVAPCIGADEFIVYFRNIAMQSIDAPVSDCALSSAETITISVTNLGIDSVLTFDAYYVVDGGTPVHETVNDTIAPLETVVYSFTTTADFSMAGNHVVAAYVTQTGEQVANNDTISGYIVQNGWDFNAAPYTMGFETGENYNEWAAYNENGGSYTYENHYSNATYAHTGSYSARYYNSSTNTGADWLFSRCFTFETGKVYSISFWYRAESASYPQSFTLHLGQGTTVADMTIPLQSYTGFTNTTYQKSKIYFTVPSTGSYNFGFEAQSPYSSWYHYIDDINVSVNPDNEAALTEVLTPTHGCGLSNAEPVSINIANMGSNIINGNLTAYYQVAGGSVVSENVAQIINPLDTVSFTFSTPIDMSVTTSDSLFVINSWVELLNDTINNNDSLTVTALSGFTPSDPVVTNDTISYAHSATLLATAADTVFWYYDAVSTIPFHQGPVYNTPQLTDTTVYYVEAKPSDGDMYVGAADTTIGSISTTSSTSYRILFDVLNPNGITIKTVDIYPNVAAGSNYKIILLSSANDTVATYTGVTTVNANEKEVVPLNFIVPFGTGYKIGFTVSPGMHRNTNGASYPYTIPNEISITGNSYNSAYYMYLYNWKVMSAGCASNRIPVTAVVLPPGPEFSATALISPATGCSDGLENVVVEIVNTGADTIDIPFDVSYQVNNTAPVTETVTSVILPGDTINYTFAAPITLPLTTGDTTYSVTVWGDLSVDTYPLDDTVSAIITSGYIPAAPMVNNDTVPYATSATLSASSPYDITWYSQPVGGTPIQTGSTINFPVLYADTTVYASVKEGGINYVGPYDNSIGSGSYVNYTTYVTYFDVLNPNGIRINSVDIFSTSAIGSTYTINIKNSSGTVIQTYSGITTQTGGARETIPVQFNVPSGNQYSIGFSVMPNVYRNDAGAVFPYTIPGEISLTGHSFTSYPNYYYYFYNWQVQVGSDCESERVPVHGVVTGIPANDAGVTAILDPVTDISLGLHDVAVEVKNFGTNTLTSVDIAWTVNGVSQTTFNWTGSLPTGSVDTVLLGQYLFNYIPYPGINEITAWTVNPNAATDTVSINDTSSISVSAHDPYNGTYYLTSTGGDFDSFNTASVALKEWGVDGPVDVKVATGTYNEQVVINSVPGASDVNRITIESESGVNSDVVVEFANTSADNYVIKLDSADYFTVKNMTLRSIASATNGRVIELANSANFNHFENNVLIGIDGSSTASAVIYSGSTGSETGNVFSGNTIDKGYYSVYLYGSSSNHKAGNYFINNDFTNFGYYGLYLYYSDSAHVIGNNLSNSPSAGTTYHMYLYYVSEGSRIESNTILGTGSSTFYGMYLYNDNTTGSNPNLIANNFISQTGNAMGTAYGIYCYGSNYQNIYNNSVLISAGSTTGGRALYHTGGSSNINIVNNNLTNTSGGYALYSSNPGAINTCRNNNLYTNGVYLGFWSIEIATLTELQTISSKNQNSLSVNPGYYSPTNLHTYQFLLRAGMPLASVTTDIDGDVRDAVNPTIGADEFIPAAVDAGVVKFDQPALVTTTGLNTVSVTLASFGNNILTSSDIAWTLDGTLQTPFAWTGSLALGAEEDSIVIGSANLTWGIHHMTSWPENPNGTMDMLPYNDTASLTLVACNGPMAGTYTIGSTGDFTTFSDAILYASSCGVSSSVVFEIQSGTYDEVVRVIDIPGASNANTITFISQSGNASDVILQPSTLPYDYAAVKFDHTSYVMWKNTTIELSSMTYARGFFLDNLNKNLTIEGNIVNLPDVSSSSTSITGIYDSDYADTNLVITNNIINDGSYSMYVYGDGSSVLQPGTIISNNSLNSFSYRGIAAFYHVAAEISGNYLHADNNTYSTIYGLYAAYCDEGLSLSENRIILESNSYGYGLYLSYNDGSTTSHGLISNNFVSLKGNGSSTSYAVYLTSNAYLDFVFNSVNLYDTYASSKALYVSSGTDYTLKNNVIAAPGGSYALYYSSTSAVTASDYNDLYSTGANLGYYTTDQTDLAALQTASGLDAHSISSDPMFISNVDLHVFIPSLNAAATPISGITTDIDGDLRDATTPDIGADEFTPLNINLGITQLLKPVNDFCNTSVSDTVAVRILNLGANTATSFTVTYKLNGVVAGTENWTGSLASGASTDVEFASTFTPQASWNNIVVYVSIAGDGDNTNDTVSTIYKGIPEVNVPFSDDFETNDIWGANITSDGWELGVPAGSVINSAYSPDLAWKTNIDGIYGNSQNIVLYSPVFSFLHAYNAQLSFWHWYDTDASDGGYIQYTSNGGTTWNNLGTLNDPSGTNWAPTAVNTGFGWSGNSGGWVYSSIDLSFLNFNPFETQFRFIFYSNSVGTNGDGWAIDNFEIFIPQADVDAGVVEIVSPAGTLTPGVQEPVIVKITNYGTSTLTSIPVVAKANTGQPPMTATWTGTLASGDTTSFTFPTNYTPVSIANFSLCAYTDIATDYITYNDTTCVDLETNVGIEDNNLTTISLNPNPADDFTMLEFEAGTTDNAVLTITTNEGKRVRETIVNISAGMNNFRIETADLAPGLYHWNLRSNSSNGEGKLIITR